MEESVKDPLSGYASWFYSQRAFPARHVPEGALAAATRKALHMRGTAPAATSSATGPAWTNLGPAPTNQDAAPYTDPVWSNYGGGIGDATGRVTAMAVDPTNADVVYEGGADGGVWKSTDGGAHWSSISDPIATQSIGAIAIPPNAHKTLYVGTGEANTNSDSYFGYGIYKSTDAGSTWTKLGGTTFDRMTVFQIVTRGNGSTVFAATDRGLYRSTDGGSTWTAVLVPGNPDHFDSFVTGVAWTYQTSGSMIAAVGYRGGRSTNGIYSSTNNGATWTFLGSPSGFDSQADIGRVALATTPGQPGLVYAAVQSVTLFNTPGAATVFKGVYKSTHGAAGPWTEVESADQMAQNQTSALTPGHIGPGYQPGIQAWYNLYVSIDPTDPSDVVVGLEEVWNSRDAGATWNVIGRYWDFCLTPDQPWCYTGGAPSHYTTHPDQHAAGWGVTSGGTPVLYVGNDGGVWSQTGPNWSNDNWTNDNNNQSTTQCYSAAASEDGTVICGLQDNGFVKYTGQSLWPAIAGGDGAEGAIDPSNSSDLIGSYVYMNIYESHNGGQTYSTISPSDPDPRFISPITMDPTDPTHIATVGQDVWETTQGFDTTTADWRRSFNMKSPNQGTALSVRGSTLYVGACGPCNPTDFTNIGSFQNSIWTNAGPGNSWHQAKAIGLPNRYITSIVQDPSDDSHIYVTLSGFSRNWIPGGGVGHVFASTDRGATFTDISGNLPDAPVSSGILSPADGSLIVGTDTGIYQRQPSGTWQPLGQGFPTVVTDRLTTIPGTDTLVAATHGRGVWTLNLG